MMADLVNMADQFKGLPMEDLIGGPLMAACKAQIKLAKSTAEYIREVGLQEHEVLDSDNKPIVTGQDESGKDIHQKEFKTRQVDFSYKKPIANSAGTSITPHEVNISAPMLAIVPVPALLVEELEVDFNMEVKSSATEHKEMKAEGGFDATIGWGPFQASIHGSVSSKDEQTRTSDNSAKYHVKVRAKQQEVPEGLSRILDMMHDTIAPTQIKPGVTTQTDGSAVPVT